MKKRADDYLITQPPLPSIARLALPLMLGSLFQQFYTMADSVIVGRFVGEGALAAVGASSALTSVFIAAAIGFMAVGLLLPIFTMAGSLGK